VLTYVVVLGNSFRMKNGPLPRAVDPNKYITELKDFSYGRQDLPFVRQSRMQELLFLFAEVSLSSS